MGLHTHLPSIPWRPRVGVTRDASALARVVAERLIETLAFRLKDEWVANAHIVVAGGVVSENVFETVADSPRRREVDWERVHVWWLDDRFVGEGHIGRHETHARTAGIARIGLPPDHLHAVPCAESEDDGRLGQAADEYARMLRKWAPHGRSVPVFDVLMAAVGSSGEIGALYPQHATLRSTESVVPVWDAPTAPKQRVTMTLPSINTATRVWLLASGTECAVSVGRALTGADARDVPAAGAKGLIETMWWLDEKAARAVPPELRYGGEAAAS